MSVEQFIEKVAWPVARPSFVGDNESFTVQTPQQHEPEPQNDHSSKATIPGVIDFSKRRLETRSNEAGHPGPVSASADASFPGVDPSLPQHTTNSFTPVIEIHEGQTMPVLPLDTSRPATPIRHLTYEKDGQTQDQSQEF